MLIKNERIKASEVRLTGVHGEDLGIIAAAEALAMARLLGVDLVCESLMSSPPPCRLISAGAAKESAAQARKQSRPAKLKELRLTPQIEQHDYETKLQQAERILKAGDAVQITVKISGKEGAAARRLVEELLRDLNRSGRPASGIQLSGKQAAVQVDPL